MLVIGPFETTKERRRWRRGGTTAHMPVPVGDDPLRFGGHVTMPRRGGRDLKPGDLVKINWDDDWWDRFYNHYGYSEYATGWPSVPGGWAGAHELERLVARYNANVDRIWDVRQSVLDAMADGVMPDKAGETFLSSWIGGSIVGYMIDAAGPLRRIGFNPLFSPAQMDSMLKSVAKDLDRKERSLDLIEGDIDHRYKEAAWRASQGKGK